MLPKKRVYPIDTRLGFFKKKDHVLALFFLKITSWTLSTINFIFPSALVSFTV
jgi:hypothetical protein